MTYVVHVGRLQAALSCAGRMFYNHPDKAKAGK